MDADEIVALLKKPKETDKTLESANMNEMEELVEVAKVVKPKKNK